MTGRDESVCSLDTLGFGPGVQAELAALADAELLPARVAIEYQDRYQVISERGTHFAQLSGILRQRAQDDRLSRPAVGDWVALRPGQGEDMGLITHLFARRTAFVRQASGRRTGAQVIAANLDTVFVVTSCNRDFNLRRMERYLATVAESGAEAVIVLNKIDLCDDIEPYRAALARLAPGTSAALVSARQRQGMDELCAHIHPGKTIALVGSSGVGKSTLVNWLVGRDVQAVGEIRAGDARGRHTTTHRELIVLPQGAVLIDTPGMRELKLWGADEGIRDAFTDIDEIAQRCRFRDCSHLGEPGCAVAMAIDTGALPKERLRSYRKLQAETSRGASLPPKEEEAQRRRHGQVTKQGPGRRRLGR